MQSRAAAVRFLIILALHVRVVLPASFAHCKYQCNASLERGTCQASQSPSQTNGTLARNNGPSLSPHQAQKKFVCPPDKERIARSEHLMPDVKLFDAQARRFVSYITSAAMKERHHTISPKHSLTPLSKFKTSFPKLCLRSATLFKKKQQEDGTCACKSGWTGEGCKQVSLRPYPSLSPSLVL